MEKYLVGRHKWEMFPIFMLTSFLTYRCTRKCPDCYAVEQNKVSDDMSNKTFEKYCEWVVDVYNQHKAKKQMMLFLGGEPLLVIDKIDKVMEYCKNNIDYEDAAHGVMFSNCDLIENTEPEKLRHIKILNFNIGETATDEVVRRLEVIKDRFGFLYKRNPWSRVGLVATLFDSNLDRFEDIARTSVERNLCMRFYRDIFKSNDEVYKDRLLRKWHNVIDIFEKYIVNGYKIDIEFLYDGIVMGWNSDRSTQYACGKGLLTVHPDGSVGNCVRNFDCKIGTLDTINIVELMKSDVLQWNWRNRTNEVDECADCDVRFNCQGGCPNDRLISYGSYNGKNPWCRIHKEIIPRIKALI